MPGIEDASREELFAVISSQAQQIAAQTNTLTAQTETIAANTELLTVLHLGGRDLASFQAFGIRNWSGSSGKR